MWILYIFIFKIINFSFLIKKNHIFKRRSIKSFKEPLNTLTSGLYTKRQYRFEFNYIKYFRKFFKKRYFRKTNFRFVKYWFLIKPNLLLSMKSKNSRMGSGVGKYVRVCSIIKPNKPIILARNFSVHFFFKLKKLFKKKINWDVGVACNGYLT